MTNYLIRLFYIAISVCASFNSGAAPGDLDASFGNGGKVITAIGSSNDLALGAALQPDGKIVVAGYCNNGSSRAFCLARHLQNGTLDTDFNSNGKVITPMGSGDAYLGGLVVQPDGRIVVAGTCPIGPNSNFCLARYLPNGALDASFSGTGKVTTSMGSGWSVAASIALHADGRLVVAGYCNNGTSADFCLARYQPNGALDASLNLTGKVVTAIGSREDVANTVSIQPDGKIVLAGRCSDISDEYFCIARYESTGALDTSFNRTGAVITPIGTSSADINAISIQPDGKIVAAGKCSVDSNYNFCLVRYLPNGELDASFNTMGKVITTIGLRNDQATALALQPDGKIVATGYCYNGNNYDFCLARYLPNGALDTSFKVSGKLSSTIGSSEEQAFAVVLQPDGKIVAAGYCSNGGNTDFCLARYEGGPNTPKTLTEYIYNPLNYYFLTSRDTEKAALDALPGWARTGQSFSTRTFADPGALGISRYYFDQIAKSQTRGSHFYTLVDSEKIALATLNPNNQSSPRLPYYEGIDSYAFLPVIEGIGGSCAAGQVPVYRAFRGQTRFPDDPNHRFTTSLTLYNQLVALGWDGEGVKLCAPN